MGGRCAQNLSKSSFISSCILIFGVAALKIWQKSFLKSFSFFGVSFFLWMPLLRAAGVGGRCAQNLAKIFFIIFLFFRRGAFCGCSFLRAARRSLRSKSFKIFFIIFFFYRRMFLLRMQQAALLRLGGRYAQNLAKIFFKIFFLFIGVSFFLWLPLLRAAEGGRCAQNLAKSFLKSFF